MKRIESEKYMKEGMTNALKKRLYEILCKYEENSDWKSNLDNVYIILNDFDNDKRTINYYLLMSKLGSLPYLNFQYFRKTIFDCITLLDKVGD